MKKIILLLLVVVVAVLLAFMSLPEDPGRQPADTPAAGQADKQAGKKEQQAAGGDAAETETVKTMEDARLEAMKAEYAKLERARRDLRQRLHDVTYYLREAELPQEKASEIRDELNSANRLLINPPLLGAFSGIDDIRNELQRYERTNQQLDAHEQILREHGAYDESGD